MCGDLTSAFNFANPNNEPLPTLPGRKTRGQADQLRAEQQQLPQILPPANPMLPVQATGTRPSRALPYELHVSARTRRACSGKVALVFANTGEAGAVFHVYDKLHLDRLPRRYTVEPGEKLDDDWAALADNAGRYDLWVLGPERLPPPLQGRPEPPARRRRAAARDPRRLPRAARRPAPEAAQRGRARLRLHHHAQGLPQRRPVDRACQVAATKRSRWELDASGQWYDFDVTCDTDPTFWRRLAGRIETGRHSVSDPAMGTA